MMATKYFIFMIFLKLYKADIALRHLHKEPNLFDGKSPKGWQTYIKAFLYNIIRSLVKTGITLPVYLYTSVPQSQSFIKQSWRKISMKEYHIIIHPEHQVHYLHHHFYVQAYNFQINSPSGQIHLLNPKILYMTTYVLSFNLNNIFTLNTTFYKLNFFKGQNMCEKPALLIRKHLMHGIKFGFCGYYATFNFYSPFSDVVFDFNLPINGQVMPFEFHVSFAVIDKNVITYISTNTKLNLMISRNLSQWYPLHDYNIQKKMTILSYYIKAKKAYQVVFPQLHAFAFPYFIFDGPGFTSPIISNKKNLVITSTFQCLLQFLFILQDLTNIINVYFYLQPQKVSKKELVVIREPITVPFNLSYYTYADLLSTIPIKAYDGLQINVTILHIFSSFSHNSECTEWGFLTIEYLDREYEESITLCSNHSSFRQQSRSFYSINSSLIIIFYSYPGAGEIKVSGVISTTKCKPVHIDPCILILLERHCNAGLQFKPYIPNIVKFLNISLISRPIIGRISNEVDLLVNIVGTHCIVLQIGNKIPAFLNLTYPQINCGQLFLYKSGCKCRISAFNSNTTIYSVRGLISEEKIQSRSSITSELSVFYLKGKSKLSQVSHTLPIETFYHQFEDITSVPITATIWGRQLNWIDIVFKMLKAVQPLHKYVNYVAELHSGMNRMPNVDNYGLQTFSDGDMSLSLSDSWLKNISIFTLLYNMSTWIEIVKLKVFKYRNILIPQSKYLNKKRAQLCHAEMC